MMLCFLLDEVARLSDTLLPMYQTVQYHIPDIILTLTQFALYVRFSAWSMKNMSVI
jgi:hypothetical protein